MKEVIFSLIVFTSPESFTCDEGKALFESARNSYIAENMPVKLKRTRFKCVKNKEPLTLENRYKVFWKLSKSIKNKNVITIAIMPLVECYTTGLASAGSRLAVVNGAPKNCKGEDRYFHSLIALEHEIAHTLKAKHINDRANKMHENALYYVNKEFLKFRQLTKNQIKKG